MRSLAQGRMISFFALLQIEQVELSEADKRMLDRFLTLSDTDTLRAHSNHSESHAGDIFQRIPRTLSVTYILSDVTTAQSQSPANSPSAHQSLSFRQDQSNPSRHHLHVDELRDEQFNVSMSRTVSDHSNLSQAEDFMPTDLLRTNILQVY